MADDILRGAFKENEYGEVVLPFVVLRRLDCVLESSKDKVIEAFEKFKDANIDPQPVLLQASGRNFYNFSFYDLSRLRGDPGSIVVNFNNYIAGFS